MADHQLSAAKQNTEANEIGDGNIDLTTDGAPNLHDSVYEALKDHFLRNGRGRRKALPHLLSVNNRILAQLKLLKSEVSGTWEEVITWFDRLFPGLSVTRGCLISSIEVAASKMTDEELDKEVSFNNLSPPLQAMGLTKSILMGDPGNFQMNTPLPLNEMITNHVFYDLELFRVKNGHPHVFIAKWLRRFSELAGAENTDHSNFSNLTDSQVKTKVATIVKTVKTLKKRTASEELEEYLKCSEFMKMKTQVNENKIVFTSTDRYNNSEIKQLKKENSLIKEELNKIRQQNENLSVLVDILQEERKEMTEKENLIQEIKSLNAQLKSQKTINKELVQKLSDVKKQKFYKRNTYLNLQLKRLRDKMRTMQKEFDTFKSVSEKEKTIKDMEISKLKKEIKAEQTVKARYRKKINEWSSLNKFLQQEKVVDIKLREDKFNQFSDDVRLTCMSLMGEGNVAAQNCSKVIKIVSEHLFKKKLPLEDLPCSASVLNFANEAYQLANHQVVENIKKSHHITFATDGTSRQKKHFLERHIVLDNGKTMSLGFTEVASEDADTLLEKSIEIISDLSEAYCESMGKRETPEEVFKEIIIKIKCLMSDRASVMKSFDKKLVDYKRQLLGEEVDVSTHFLFCNAHFLLGLAKSTEDALKISEKDIGKLGRDLDSNFSNFSKVSETAAFRLLRLAADVFGPRGDEKSGCREEWLAYCESKEKTSKFTSHRTNRFNNVFENASAILFHLEDMIEFLSDYVSHTNLELKSILADLKDARLISIITAIALFHVNFTGPYWTLMNSRTSYGDFPKFVSKMKKSLNDWSDVGFDFQTQNVKPVFGDEFKVGQNFNINLNNCQLESGGVLKSTFVEIVNKAKVVLQRQLSDFLQGGVFGGDIDDSVMEILKTCPLTNLSGERLFGNLDFDISKRRHASLHLRTTVNMWKLNKTSKWIQNQKEVKVRKLLSNARKYGGVWKMRSKERQKNVRAKIKQRIKENMEKKRAQECKKLQEKNNLLLEIIHHGGPCSSKEDLDELMRGPNVKNNLKNQIKFRKLVLNENTLSTTGNIRQLHHTLCQSLGLEVDTNIQRPPKKKRRVEK